jgi:Mrp family chromosome partitioning ATPase
VMLVSDPLDLAHVVDGVVLVAAGGHTPRHQVAAALSRLGYANGKILGIVLNKVRLHRADYPHYYAKTYQRYYHANDYTEAEQKGLEEASPEDSRLG